MIHCHDLLALLYSSITYRCYPNPSMSPKSGNDFKEKGNCCSGRLAWEQRADLSLSFGAMVLEVTFTVCLNLVCYWIGMRGPVVVLFWEMSITSEEWTFSPWVLTFARWHDQMPGEVFLRTWSALTAVRVCQFQSNAGFLTSYTVAATNFLTSDCVHFYPEWPYSMFYSNS